MSIRYIGQKLAAQIDEELMGPAGAFSLDQLMELAGLSCAQAVARQFPREKYRKVLVACGPGNQGGDGLVCARHLHMFQYEPTVYLPKPGSKDIYQRLLTQCRNLDIPVIKEVEEFKGGLEEAAVVVDAIFGFSFHPPLRPPFTSILPLLSSTRTPIFSVDIPSGWDVERGRQTLEKEGEGEGEGGGTVDTFEPQGLISLTAPKEGVREYTGRHWLGGRFIPDSMVKKYELNLPPYEGVDQVVELPRRT